ncbi:hypothetical protein [Staphylococcus agnetis]|uniref:hypothetical protein n=1 Tax=Staphylococcus agnetis TaxID=985762 RepID=UPI001319DA6F|nr:hypothetical protein [Staphylococcus agnetis]
MKIIITLIIACVLIFTACSKNEEKNQNNSSNESKNNWNLTIKSGDQVTTLFIIN